MCWMFFGQRFGHACNIGFVDLLRSGALQRPSRLCLEVPECIRFLKFLHAVDKQLAVVRSVTQETRSKVLNKSQLMTSHGCPEVNGIDRIALVGLWSHHRAKQRHCCQSPRASASHTRSAKSNGRLRNQSAHMSSAGPTDTDIVRTSEWRDSDNYAFVNSLPAAGCAWEFLRRNPDYQKAWLAASSELHRFVGESCGATAWGLVRFESPERDARLANVFWQRSVSRDVLPVIASRAEHAEQIQKLPPYGLQCRVTMQAGRDGEQHILFAEEGRFLQLEVHGLEGLENVRLTTEIVLSFRQAAARVQALRRFSDMIAHGHLRAFLYPPDKRASRLARLLQVLDGCNARASHRDIALAIFGEERVSADWRDPGAHLRDHVRRAFRSGRALMMSGYRQLLK